MPECPLQGFDLGQQPTRRPPTVTWAMGLWVTLGSVLCYIAYQTFHHTLQHLVLPMALSVLLFVAGLTIGYLGLALGKGLSSARVPLTVLGLLSCFVLWPMIFFVVPPVVLQFSPPSKAWFDLPEGSGDD